MTRQMKRQLIRRLMAAMAVAGATCVATAGQVDWKPQNGSTDITDAANWNGGVLPGVGSLARLANGGLTADYVVKVPASASPFQLKSGLFIDGVNDGQTVTLDATEGTLLVQTDSGVAWDSNVPFRVRSWDHIFDVDNAHVPGNAANEFGFTLANGTLSFKRDLKNGSVITIDGDFNNAIAPDGTECPHRTVFFHDTNAYSKNSKVIFKGGESQIHYVQFRGRTEGHELRIEGGHVHFTGGLSIGNDMASLDKDTNFRVTGDGQATVENNSLWIGRDNVGRGVLRIDGNGTFKVAEGATVTYFPDGAAQRGLLSLGGHGEWASAKQINVGHNGGTADILVEENAYFNQWAWFNFGSHDGCHVALTMKDDSYARIVNGSIVKDANAGKTRAGTIDLSGNAILDLKTNGEMANKDGSVLTINMAGKAQFRCSKTDAGQDWFMLGNNSAATVNLNLNGGTIGKFGGGELIHFQLRNGPQSVYNFSGVTLNTQNFAIEGKANKDAPDAWHTVHQTAGTVNVRQHGSGDGLDIRGGNGRNAMYSLEGGTLNVGNMMRVGHNMTTADGETWRSVFRQTGGQANLSCNVNLCDGNSSGEVELLGGRTRLNAIRGWNKSVVRGGKYNARGYFNGGTIEPWSNGITFIYTMSELKLGEKGLTVDTLAFDNVAVQGLFENEGVGTAAEVAGLFVKKGTGTLKTSMKEASGVGAYANRPLLSTHTYTRIDEGMLRLVEAEDVAFGQNITVKGGASLSLDGTAKTLTVKTLTLGDGTPFATLKVDAGDTVVITEANGLTAASAQLDVAWITDEGTYPIFICQKGVDADQLDNINLKNAPAGKDYGWITSTDAEGVTTCSVVVAPLGTLTSSIDYADGTGTKTGTGPVAGITGSGTTDDTLKLAHSVTAEIAAGETLTLGGELKGFDSVFTKTGSGKLTISGENTNLGASFSSQGGTLALDGLAALGALNYPLVLGNGTFKYTGEPAVFTGGLELNGATAGKSVILENDGDMTFHTVTHVRGTFVKKGVGKLTFNLPAGRFQAGHSDVDGNYGLNGGDLVFPESGDAPETKAGLAGFTIAEGTLKVKGAGMTQTTLETDNTSILATSYAAKAAPILEVEDARVNFGKGSHHARFMQNYPKDSPSPELRLKNAYVWADSAHWGGESKPAGALFKMTMKDSVAFGNYNMLIGYAGLQDIQVDADNSRIETDGTQLALLGGQMTMDFHGSNAGLGSFNAVMTGDNNNAGTISSQDHPKGLITFRDGARMKTTRGIKFANSQLNVTFNGGIFEIVAHNSADERGKTSIWNRAGKGFTTTGDGLEIAICEGSTHAFNFPVMGDGSVTKTGAGTFKLVAPRTAGEKLLQSTGTLTVAEGTMVLDGALVKEEIDVVVAEGAVLDLNGSTLKAKSITGKGTVVNGTVQLTQIAYNTGDWATMGEGASIAAGTILVDFKDATFTKAQYAAGIVITTYTGAKPTGIVLKAINVDPEVVPNARSQTVIEDGKIMLKVVPSGFTILVI